MRELTKSMLSFSWAMSMFGLEQMANALTPSTATSSFDAVTRCTKDQLRQTTQAAFQAGDNLQRGLVDLTFSFLTAGLWQPNRNRGDASRGIPGLGGGGRGDRDQGGRMRGDVGQQAVRAQAGGRPQGGGTQSGVGPQGGGTQRGGSQQGGVGQQGGWTQGGGSPQGVGGPQGGWTQGGVGQQGDWTQGGLLGDVSQQGGWSQGDPGSGTAGEGWSMSGGESAVAAGAEIGREVGNLTAEAMSGGIDLMQQGINAAAQVVESGSARQPGGTGGDQGAWQGSDYQTPGSGQQ